MQRQEWTRHDLVLALSLSALTLLSRWPYRARMLYNWDAVQFALALKEYDVAKHQPHPPGYILYVGLGRLLNSFLHYPPVPVSPFVPFGQAGYVLTFLPALVILLTRALLTTLEEAAARRLARPEW